MGDNNILTFCATGSTKKYHFKKLPFGQFFLFVFVKFIDFFTGLKALSPGQKQNLYRSF